MDGPLRFGVDRLLADPSILAGYRAVGLVTNQAARPASAPAQLSRSALVDAGVPLVRLFGPEHGLTADADDGATVDDGFDPVTRLPVVSLYGAHMRPTPSHLAGLDAILFDIPDIGARFYTYCWTLWHVMAACEHSGIPLWVLDRPNPLGGDLSAVEGPWLDPACRSFIGEDVIPIRHGLTLGELAGHWQRTRYPALRLEVVTMRGWDGRPAWGDTGCPWIQTSPAMPTVESTVWYPGLCLFEATNLSVGRGTAHPFTWIGAPWLDAERLADQLNAADLPAVRFEATHFVPTMLPHAGVPCQAVRLHLTAPSGRRHAAIRGVIRPVRTALFMLRAVMRHADFRWASYVTAANPSGGDHFSRLVGTAAVAPWLTQPDDAAFEAAITSLLEAPQRDAWGRDVLRYAM